MCEGDGSWLWEPDWDAAANIHWRRKYSVPRMGGFNHIDKHNMTKLFVYHKAWYYQGYDTCRPTCVGSSSPKSDRDTDALAEPRVCDADDHLCPSDNTSPTWEEFTKLIQATRTNEGVHPNCPKPDPCVTSPPPCFYISTQCVPTIVLQKTLDNSDTRNWEDTNQNEDEKYLHEPITAGIGLRPCISVHPLPRTVSLNDPYRLPSFEFTSRTCALPTF